MKTAGRARATQLYFDNAATTYPKPPAVYRAVAAYARQVGIGNDRALTGEAAAAGAMVAGTRLAIARLIDAGPESIILNSGATESLNTVILGLLKARDHVLVSPYEHNSVMRPLRFLQKTRGVKISVLPASLRDGIDPGDIRKHLTPRTRLCVINHISNVCGLVSPVREIGRVLKEHGVFFLVDGAQSVGCYPLDVRQAKIDCLCFAGHKGLFGPTGTGGFYLDPAAAGRITPLKYGGTGFKSNAEISVAELPYRFEVGTQNTWGLAGLRAGAEWVGKVGVKAISNKIELLTAGIVACLRELKQAKLYLPGRRHHHGAVAFNFGGFSPADTAALLDNLFHIKVRAGLHCSPEAHRFLATLPRGTVRLSVSCLTAAGQVEKMCRALHKLEDNYVAER